MEVLSWYAEHWVLGSFLVLVVCATIASVVQAVFGRRIYRVEVVQKDR